MRQYIVYINANPASRDLYPYLLDVQSPLLESLHTRLVIPLSPKSRLQEKVMRNLTPTIKINGGEYLALIPQMAAISRKDLGGVVLDCSVDGNEILSSIDFLITGF